MDHKVVQMEDPHTALLGKIQERVTRHEHVLEGFKRGDTDGLSLDLALDGSFHLGKLGVHTGLHLGLHPQLLQRQRINVQAKARGVRREEREEEL